MRLGFLSGLITIFLASAVVASPDFWRNEWPDTNFEKTTVSNWVEIVSGGPPKDGIPALSDPSFVRASGQDGDRPDRTGDHAGDGRTGAGLSDPVSDVA